MTPNAIFGLELVLSVISFSLAARWFVAPRLARLTLVEALTPLLWIQTLRTAGMTFLLPSVAGAPLPASFAGPGAYGDLLSAVLAFVALLALRTRWRSALVVTWMFSIIGLLDFVSAFARGISADFAGQPAIGPLWYIPTFFVPLLAVAQVLVVWLLVTRGVEYRVTPRTSAVVGV